MTRLQEVQQYVERWKAAGKPAADFACPGCHQLIPTTMPPRGEIWDSLTECPHCREIFTKVTELGRPVLTFRLQPERMQ